MDKYNKLVSNTLIFAAGTFTSKVLVLLLMPLYTSILSTQEYGVADLITQAANMIIPLACVGICDGLLRFTLDSSDKKKVFSSAICILLCGTAVLIAVSPLLSLVGYFDGYVWLICAYVICSIFHSACAQYVRAQGRVALFAAQGILNTVLTIVYNILFLIVFDMGATGYVLAVVAADLTVTFALFFAARIYRDFSFSDFDKKIAADMLRFSIPYIPTTMLWLITGVSDRFIVTYFCGEDANGLYSAAYKIPTLLTLMCGVFNEAWQISAVKDSEGEERSDFFGKVYGNYLSFMLVGASFLIAASQIITKILLADSYYTSWIYVPILVMATMFSALVSFMGSVYFVEKKSVYSMMTALAGAAVNVVLNFLMIPRHGAMGAAVATLISYAAVYCIRIIDTKHYMRFDTHTVKLAVNALLILFQSLVMVSQVRFYRYVSVAVFLIVLALNFRGIAVTVKAIFDRLLKIKRKS